MLYLPPGGGRRSEASAGGLLIGVFEGFPLFLGFKEGFKKVSRKKVPYNALISLTFSLASLLCYAYFSTPSCLVFYSTMPTRTPSCLWNTSPCL